MITFTVKNDDGTTLKISHALQGVVFKKWVTEDEEGNTEIRYVPPMEEVENIRDFLLCRECTLGHVDGQYYLVRHGEGSTARYYPLPLLFLGKDARIRSAIDGGHPPINERWVRKQQRRLLAAAGLTTADLNDEMIVEI